MRLRFFVNDVGNVVGAFANTRQRWLVVIVVVSCLLFLAATTDAQPNDEAASSTDTQVTLHVRDGRIITGQVDQRTDHEVLWLRVSRNGVHLSSGLTWDLVQEISVADKSYTASDFRELAHTYASRAPQPSTTPSANKAPRLRVSTRAAHVRTTSRVQSLELEGQIANWDRDSDSDGIALRVFPLAADGRVLPVDGVISVELIGRNFVDSSAIKGFPQLGQWSQRVRAADFDGAGGAVYHLPIPTPLDHDPTVLSIGMVRAHLTIFGQGHFEAETPIRLRKYNPIRDQFDEYHQRHDAFGRYRARHW